MASRLRTFIVVGFALVALIGTLYLVSQTILGASYEIGRAHV